MNKNNKIDLLPFIALFAALIIIFFFVFTMNNDVKNTCEFYDDLGYETQLSTGFIFIFDECEILFNDKFYPYYELEERNVLINHNNNFGDRR